MKLRLYCFILLLSVKSSFVYSAENRSSFFSFKDFASGFGMMFLLNVVHESGHIFANYLTGGKFIEMNVGSQSNGNQISYASLGKIRITGFNPTAMHVQIAKKICENGKQFERDNIFISFAGPLAAITTAGLSLYALNKYGIIEDYPVVQSVCLAILIGNIIQLLPFEILGTKTDGLRAYESYQRL